MYEQHDRQKKYFNRRKASEASGRTRASVNSVLSDLPVFFSSDKVEVAERELHRLQLPRVTFLASALVLSIALSLSIGFPQGAVLLANTAAYDAQEQQAIYEAQKELFTLEQVQKESRDRGTEAKDARANMTSAATNKTVADMGVEVARDFGFSSPDEITDAIVKAVSNQADAGTALDDAKAELITGLETAMYTGERLFFEYLQLQDSLALLEKSIDLSREQLRIEELKARLGLSTDIEVQKKALSLDNLLERKESVLSGIELKGRSLLQQMGRDPGQAFRLDPAFSMEGLQTIYDPDQLADLAVKNNLDLMKVNRNIDKLYDAIHSTTLVLPGTDRAAMSAQRDALILTRDKAIDRLKLGARGLVTSLSNTRGEIELLEKSILEKETAYTVMELQVSLGLAPKLGLAAADMDLLTVRNDLTKARQTYYLSLRQAALLLRGISVSSM